MTILSRLILIAATAAICASPFLFLPSQAQTRPAAIANEAGVIRVKSAYGVDETIARLKADIAAKGIRFFDEIDQSRLGAETGIKLNRSTLLLFGNPPLGIQFLTANADAGLDWPVRMLVSQDARGQVWVSYTDFTYIAHRHRIMDRDPQFAMATMVSASIASSVQR